MKTDRIILITGLTGTGKTTLLQFFAEGQGSKIQHLNENGRETATSVIAKIDWIKHNVVIIEEFEAIDEQLAPMMRELIHVLEKMNRRLIIVAQMDKLKSLEGVELKKFRLQY
jgi:Holliday junction resolvasome RuvABC ATP-dependent DNA helicase subunit